MSLEMVLKSLINAIIFTLLEIYVGEKITKEKVNLKSLSNILVIMLYIVMLIVNAFITDKFLKSFSLCIILILLYKKIFNSDWIKSISLGLTIYIITFASEIVVGSVLIIMSSLLNIQIMKIISNTVIANIIIALPVLLISKVWNKKIVQVFSFLESKGEGVFVAIFAILSLIFSVILNRYDMRNWLFDFEFYINIIIFIIVLIILLIIIKQYNDNVTFFNKYKEIVHYSNLTSQVLEEYRMKTHEYKNQLAIIKALIEPKNRELSEYVDTLIENNKNIKYSWVNQVKYITLPALKGLINYKITEFNALNINTSIVVSKELEKVKFDEFSSKDKDDLYTIIGVYLDNAKEAALQSKKTKIDIDISNDNGNMKIIISNTYKGKIDESKLDNYRYSTKGKERGIGLHLVKKVIDNSNRFEAQRKITDKYYIQTLYIIKKDNTEA